MSCEQRSRTRLAPGEIASEAAKRGHMSNQNEIRVLVCCHYYAGGSSLLEREGMLEEALRSRGFTGKILIVETKKKVTEDPAAVAALSTEIMRERGWREVVDTFTAALGSFKHSIVVYGNASPASSSTGGR